MHPRTTAAVLLAAAGLALTGCSSSSGGGHAPATPSTAPAHDPARATATAASEPPVPPGDQYATSTRTAACWRAIRDQYTPGTVQLTGAPTQPPACAGLSTDEVSAIAADVLQHQTDG